MNSESTIQNFAFHWLVSVLYCIGFKTFVKGSNEFATPRLTVNSIKSK